MIKGCQKKIIFVQGGESSPFENAYFILRKENDDIAGSDNILREADRIISESVVGIKKKYHRRKKLKSILASVLSLLTGVLCGSLFTFIMTLLSK